MTLIAHDRETASIPESLKANSRTLEVLNEWDLGRVQDYVQKENSFGVDPAKAVVEYRRFIFMALSAQHPCVPSRAVDEVWHAHLLHSRDYLAFCKAIGRDYIHHEPALPGEKANLIPHFEQTTAFYEKCFGEKPDQTVWGVGGQAVCVGNGPDCTGCGRPALDLLAICDVKPGADCRGHCSHNCRNQ